MIKKHIFKKEKLAVTLVELIVTVVIAGILVGFALPYYRGYMEKNRVKNGEVNLIAIYQAQKRFRLDRPDGSYCISPTCAVNTTLEINDALDLDIIDPYFDYRIEPDGTNGFKAIAKRNSGHCIDKEMNVTNLNSEPYKGDCDIW